MKTAPTTTRMGGTALGLLSGGQGLAPSEAVVTQIRELGQVEEVFDFAGGLQVSTQPTMCRAPV